MAPDVEAPDTEVPAAAAPDAKGGVFADWLASCPDPRELVALSESLRLGRSTCVCADGEGALLRVGASGDYLLAARDADAAARLAGSPAGDGKAPAFTDVAPDTWYTNAVAWANGNGIVTGYGNGLFGGTDSITREQLVVMLYRYAKLMKHDTAAAGDLSAFTDAGNASDWAVEALRWAYAEGLITGRTATTIVPQGTATRAEVAMILMRFGEELAK